MADDPRITPLLANAESLVTDFRYEDRKHGIQISDEQGTRNRSYRLIVDFDRSGVDDGISTFGSEPWGAWRPTVLVFLSVADSVGSYVVGRESMRGLGLAQK